MQNKEKTAQNSPVRSIGEIPAKTRRAGLPGAVAALLTGAIAPALAAYQAPLPNGVAAGDMTQTSAVLWARPSVPGRLSFTYATDAALTQNPVTVGFVTQDINHSVKAPIKNLKPNTEYFYCGADLLNHKSCGRFRTLSLASSSQGVVFGVSGRLEWSYEVHPGINNVPDQGLDFLFDMSDMTDMGGTNYSIYSQFAGIYRKSLEPYGGFPNAYANLRASTGIYPILNTAAIRDDFAGGAAPASDPRFDNTGNFINETSLYKTGVAALIDHWPSGVQRFGNTGDPRTASKIKFERNIRVGKDAMFVSLDSGSFRDTPIPPPANPFDSNQAAQYLAQTYAPGRTALGGAQLADVKNALLDAQAKNICWKFIAMKSAVQSFGVFGTTPYRLENYAAERNELLGFIARNNIKNVVFIGNLPEFSVNNLGYQTVPGYPQTPVNAWEITVPGAATYASASAGALVQAAVSYGLITPDQQIYYQNLPVAPDGDDIPNDKDDFIKQLFNQILLLQNLDTIGLAGSSIPATLKAGDYFADHSVGWAKFQIEPGTRKLTVTVYGVESSTPATFDSDPATYTALVPQIISEFEVLPQ